MTITEHLDSLRSQFPECDIAAYADLSTGMVLAATCSTKVSQECLDGICNRATETLSSPLAKSIASTIMNREDDEVRQAVRLTPRSMEIFVRSSSAKEDAMCLICAHGVDIDRLSHHGWALLDKIEAEH